MFPRLLSVLVRLRLGLVAADVCVRFKLSEGTYNRLFTSWICFLSKELRLLFPFPLVHKLIIDAMLFQETFSKHSYHH